MVMDEKTLNQTIERLTSRQRVEFWGCVYEFDPPLLERVFGDGNQLVLVFPIMERPHYWVVRVDSQCTNDDALLGILDEIRDAIEYQFGLPDEADLGVGNDRPYFPMLDGENGFAWDFARAQPPASNPLHCDG